MLRFQASNKGRQSVFVEIRCNIFNDWSYSFGDITSMIVVRVEQLKHGWMIELQG
jgi:hypothetical protein